MTRKGYYAPNAFSAVHERWRNDGRIRAIGAMTCHGGLMSGKHLAAILGISPRGLRQILCRDPVFEPQIRDGADGRGETWYRLNMAALPEQPLPPPLQIGTHAGQRRLPGSARALLEHKPANREPVAARRRRT